MSRAIGPFTLTRELGRGGYGAVHVAVDGRDGAEVALKLLGQTSESQLASIRREIQALTEITARGLPGVARIVASGVDEGVPWYAMELVRGRTLRAMLAGSSRPSEAAIPTLPLGETTASIPTLPDPGRSPLADALSLARRICLPLSLLHGEGIVHRDLKPENVIFQEDGTPVLVDFGLASRFAKEGGREALEMPPEISGTAAYMAPEQCRGEQVDARADLYALGCILHELLTGAPPFEGATAGEVLAKHLMTEAEPPSRYVPGIPPRLDGLVGRLLSKTPRERIGHAEDVGRALEELGAEPLPAGSPRPRAYLYRPSFVERSSAWKPLSAALADLMGGAGSARVVRGESGSGKTRLLSELGARAKAAGCAVLVGECAAAAHGAAGVGQVLSGLRAPLVAVADRCRERGPAATVEALGPHGKLLVALEPSFAALPGIAELPDPPELPPAAARDRLLDAVLQLLRAGAPRRGLLLAIDDVQWADELTLALVERLSRQERRRPAVVAVAACRAEETGPGLERLLAAPGIEVVELGRFDEAEVAHLVGEMLAVAAPGAELVRALLRQSEGNPLFVAEYLRGAILEGHLLRDEEGRWLLSDDSHRQVARLALPRTLTELIRRRLDGLPADALALARVAAVGGRSVAAADLPAVAGLAAVATADLAHVLNTLVARLVLEEPQPGSLRFSHDKMREVAYAGIPHDARRALHLAHAAILEPLAPSRGVPGLQELARHLTEGGATESARAAHLVAAGAARRARIHEAADLSFRDYFALSPELSGERVQARMDHSTSLVALARLADAELAGREALREARELQDRRLVGDALRSLGDTVYLQGRHDDARVLLEEVASWQEEGPIAWDARGLLAGIHQEQGRVEEALVAARELLVLARGAGDDRRAAKALSCIATIEQERGRFEDASRAHEEALASARKTGDGYLEGLLLNNLGNCRREMGMLTDARDLLEACAALASAAGHHRMQAAALLNLAGVTSDLGSLASVGLLYESALAVTRRVGERRFEGIVLANLAYWHLLDGRPEEALRMVDQARELLAQVGDRRFGALALRVRAETQAALGNLVLAAADAEAGAAGYAEVGDRRNVAHLAIVRAHILRLRGRPGEALELLAEARATLAELGERTIAVQADAETGLALLALGGDASTWLARCRKVSAELGLHPSSVSGRAVRELEQAF